MGTSATGNAPRRAKPGVGGEGDQPVGGDVIDDQTATCVYLVAENAVWTDNGLGPLTPVP
jgi:hypothetical protein